MLLDRTAMPELPEVETTMRALAARLIGRQITGVVQRRADLRVPIPERLAERVVGCRLIGFARRAKYIVAHLDDRHSLLMHLGMSGRLLFGGPPAGRHEHLTFDFDDGTVLRLVDPRRFGLLDLVPTPRLDSHPRLAGLGLEPLDPGFDGATLAAALAGRHSALKLALMDQRLVVGVGNIYACESLFRARLSPRRRAGDVRLREAERLAAALRAVLSEAIDAGGSSLRDYVQTDGQLGFFQERFAVYGLDGRPCQVCGRAIRRLVQANRSTFYCARCQR
jgi:formamidopyrimidine-DNA glycosylase